MSVLLRVRKARHPEHLRQWVAGLAVMVVAGCNAPSSEMALLPRYEILARKALSRLDTRTESPFDRALIQECWTAVSREQLDRAARGIPDAVLRSRGLLRIPLEKAIKLTQGIDRREACGTLLWYMRACNAADYTNLISGEISPDDQEALLFEPEIVGCPAHVPQQQIEESGST